VDSGGYVKKYGPVVGWTLCLVLLAVLTFWRTDEPHLRHSSALNSIFDARWLIAGARLLIGVTLVYVLLSIGVRIQKGQWVRSAGSLETDAGPAQAIADSQQDLQQALGVAKATTDDLAMRLDRSLEVRARAGMASSGTTRSLGRDRSGADPTLDEIQRRVEEDRAAVQRAREESRRIAAALEESQRVRRDSLPKLKRAWLVR
jgi:hypothetical protein